MTNVYEHIDPTVITVAARELLANEDRRANRNDVLANWFPFLETDRIQYTGLRPPLRTFTEAAPFRAFDTPAPVGTRPGVAWFRGSMPPISIKYPWGELDQHQVDALLQDTNSPITPELLRREIIDDVGRGTLAIRNRMMAAAAEVVRTGALTITENGLQALTVNFGRDANRVTSVATPWATAASATPITDEKGRLTILRDEADLYPEDLVVMMTQSSYDNWLATDQVRNLWDTVRVPDMLSDEQGFELRRRHNLPDVIINDKRIRGVGQSSGSKIVPDTSAIYLPRDEAVGNTQYGQTAIAKMGQVQLNGISPGGLVSYVTYSVDPPGFWTVVDGIGLPTLTAPNLTAVLNNI